MILLIDNYDSFVHNLARYAERLGHSTRVLRNDAIDADQVADLKPEAIILSPGPCTPREAGCSVELVRRFHETIPILGVCLGHQAIAAAFGANIVRAKNPLHGRSSPIEHQSTGLFSGLPNPLTACRYHSLVIEEETLPSELVIDAYSPDGDIMAITHKSLPVYGLQFHPEAILTDGGYSLLNEFFRRAGLAACSRKNLPTDELRPPPTPPEKEYPMPLTF